MTGAMSPEGSRRRGLLAAALVAGLAPAWVRHARGAEAPRSALGADTARFALGVASGQPRPERVVLWTRITGDELPNAVDVQWELAHDERFTRIAARGTETAEVDWAHSVHAEPAGLDPGRWYWYRFSALGQRSAVGRTRTAPPPDAQSPRLQFAIASGQRWDHGHYAAWRDVVQADPDLVLFLGDYIYEYPSSPLALRRHRGGEATTLEQYRDRHALYKSDPLLQAAHAACPWLMVWDDHEVSNDYAGWQGERLGGDFVARRKAAYQAYWEHQPFPKSARPRDGWMRIHDAFDWGRLARIHCLDDRQYRDAQACPPPGRGGSTRVRPRDCAQLMDPGRSLLGADQERWLAEGWSLEHRWNLVAQQTLMARAHREDPARAGGLFWTDGWDGYPAARRRLLGGVAERGVPGVVVLGGDIHAHAVADLRIDPDDERAPVVASEFCGTSISSRGPSQASLDALAPFNPHLHWWRGDRRGSIVLRAARDRLDADLRAVDDARDPNSPVRSAARFSVVQARPGIQRG